jgi:hypothetical protein
VRRQQGAEHGGHLGDLLGLEPEPLGAKPLPGLLAVPDPDDPMIRNPSSVGPAA